MGVFYIRKKIVVSIVVVSGICFWWYHVDYKSDELKNIFNDFLEDYSLPKVEHAEFFQDYLLELWIPSINLRQDVYDINSSLNQVDAHVEILASSIVSKNVFFLAGHSGQGGANYFNDIVKLQRGDCIELCLKDRVLHYVVDRSYYISKNGYLYVPEELQDVLFLITCSLKYWNQQLVVVAYLT